MREFKSLVIARGHVLVDRVDPDSALDTVHDWHVDIHENRFQWTTQELRFDLLQGFLSIRSTIGLNAVSLQDGLEGD